MLLNILILFVGLFLLILGGDFLVRGASSIALRAHISPLVVGLTIVAFGTSAPELLISIKAAMQGSPDMTMGNIIGSNICNLALVLGVTASIGNIPVKADSIRLDWPMAMGSSLLLYFIVRFEEFPLVSRIEGLLFILIISIYTIFIIKKSRKETKALRSIEDDFELPESSSKHKWKEVGFIIFGCAGLYFGAEWFVGSARNLAFYLGVSERVIGITVVALGTSLPELVTAIVASIKRETDLALGNLMGSNIFNVLSILGVTSIIKEISVNVTIVNQDMISMLAITLLVLPLMLFRRKMGRFSGILLLSIYFYYTYSVIS